MSNNISLKSKLLNHLLNLVDEKIFVANHAIHNNIDARKNETKSAMGDKYETGMAMLQIEQENNELQLFKAQELRNELLKIDVSNTFKKVEFGSFVITNSGNYFISIGLGKVNYNEDFAFCISLASPIGKAIEGKKVKNKIKFQSKEIEILEIV